jgi:hypothetical protein
VLYYGKEVDSSERRSQEYFAILLKMIWEGVLVIKSENMTSVGQT